MDPPTPVEVNIDIEKTQGIAIYSSLLGLQNTLDNFELDVNKDSLRLVVHNAIKEAISEHLVEQDKSQLEKEEKLRSEGKPGTVLEAYQQATKINAEAIDKFNNNTHAIKRQYKVVADAFMELEGVDLMFSDQEVMPMHIKDYREYMKERKKEAKDKRK